MMMMMIRSINIFGYWNKIGDKIKMDQVDSMKIVYDVTDMYHIIRR